VSPVSGPVEPTDRIICQGQALVRAVEALETIQATGPLERAMGWLPLEAYRRRLRAIVVPAPRGRVRRS
jgi:hypothetical protein